LILALAFGCCVALGLVSIAAISVVREVVNAPGPRDLESEVGWALYLLLGCAAAGVTLSVYATARRLTQNSA
jgi:hypothetical protein